MIIILGGSGYVGGAFQQYFLKRGLPYRNITRSEVDYQSYDHLVALLREVKPRFLICAAGYTGKPNVDACELHKAECLSGNAVLPGVVQRASEATGTPWGHVSSGCIFTGDKGRVEVSSDGVESAIRGFTEEDAPNFSFRQNHCSFYSGTKALGEEVLGFDKAYYAALSSSRSTSPSTGYVWRLRIPFNEEESPRNYLTKVIRYQRLLEATNSLSQLQEFVRACWETFEKGLPFGLYNVTNPGYVTTREVTELIRKSGVSQKDFVFFQDESDFMQQAAKTPRSNCVLDSSKLLRHGIYLTEVHEAIEIALRNWKAGGQF